MITLNDIPALAERKPWALATGLLLVHLLVFLLMYGLIQSSLIAAYAILIGAGSLALLRGLTRPDPKLFNIVKVVSILVTAWIMLPFSHGLVEGVIWQWLIWGLLLANITEAVIYDLVKRNWVNALTGSLLILAMSPASGIVPDTATHVIAYPLPWLWLAAYTFWNFAFSSRYYPYVAPAHLAMLLAPLLIEWHLPGNWLQARTYAMAVYFLFSFGFWDIKQQLHITALANPVIAINPVGTWIAAVLAIVCLSTC